MAFNATTSWDHSPTKTSWVEPPALATTTVIGCTYGFGLRMVKGASAPSTWCIMARALGGAGLVMTEMCAVAPEGRITPACPGLWTDEQADGWSSIVDFAHAAGSAIGVPSIVTV